MESMGRTAAEHVTGTGMAQLAIDRHAASATRQAVTAPASTSLEGIMETIKVGQHTYVKVESVPGGLRWDTPRANQGQICTVSYADVPPRSGEAGPGSAYRMHHDASDRTTTYYRLEEDRRHAAQQADRLGFLVGWPHAEARR